ncbi:MAG TPA: C1 family peptidase [Syntrophobacteraceae bacterium]|nr:C1 family peptidase [Syntrophobacteraceae bacterium]
MRQSRNWGMASWLICLAVVVVGVAVVQVIGAGAQTVADLNRQIAEENLSWTAGETSLSQLSPEERQARLGGLPTPEENIRPEQIWEPEELDGVEGLPVDYDLRSLNRITPVKDQGNCGSCWAFAAVANLESLARKKNKDLILSEQNVLDCSAGTCAGWYLDTTFNFLKSYGTCLQSFYPYTAVKGSCQTFPMAAKLKSWKWINPYGTPTDAYNTKIKKFIYKKKQPVSCRMEVYTSFFDYESGVYQHLPCDTMEGGHFVLIIGWGKTLEGVEYWICKNSWGTGWGQDGYFWIKMNDSKIGTYTIGAKLKK